jgi:hypothetical protein
MAPSPGCINYQENCAPGAKHRMGTLLFWRGTTCANGGKCSVFWGRGCRRTTYIIWKVPPYVHR